MASGEGAKVHMDETQELSRMLINFGASDLSVEDGEGRKILRARIPAWDEPISIMVSENAFWEKFREYKPKADDGDVWVVADLPDPLVLKHALTSRGPLFVPRGVLLQLFENLERFQQKETRREYLRVQLLSSYIFSCLIRYWAVDLYNGVHYIDVEGDRIAIAPTLVADREAVFDALDEHNPQNGHDASVVWVIGLERPYDPGPAAPSYLRVFSLDEFEKALKVLNQKKRKSNGRAASRRMKDDTTFQQAALSAKGLTDLLQSKIDELIARRPNDPDVQKRLQFEILELRFLQRSVEALHAALSSEITAATGSAQNANASTPSATAAALSFQDGVQRWWERNHSDILDSSFRSGLFCIAASVLSALGMANAFTIGIVGTIAGGKPVGDIVKGIARTWKG
jgi:hypothetical protein